MLIHSASQLLTLAGGPQRGNQLGTLGIIQNGAVLVRNGLIVETGSSELLIKKYPDKIRAGTQVNQVVMPGFVDPHTHLIFAGDRAREFEMRLQGMTYMQILAAAVESSRLSLPPGHPQRKKYEPPIKKTFAHGIALWNYNLRSQNRV